MILDKFTNHRQIVCFSESCAVPPSSAWQRAPENPERSRAAVEWTDGVFILFISLSDISHLSLENHFTLTYFASTQLFPSRGDWCTAEEHWWNPVVRLWLMLISYWTVWEQSCAGFSQLLYLLLFNQDGLVWGLLSECLSPPTWLQFYCTFLFTYQGKDFEISFTETIIPVFIGGKLANSSEDFLYTYLCR